MVAAGSRSFLADRQNRPQANPPASAQLSVTLQSQISILYAASPHQTRSLPITGMHYSPIFICFVAVFLCFAAHRTNGLPSSEHDSGARYALAMEEDNQLIQLLEGCDQALDKIPTTTTGSCTSLPPGFPETCKKLMAILEKLLNTHHSIVPRLMPDIDQIPIGLGRNYGLQHTASETATKVQFEQYNLAARSFDLITRTAGRNRSREVCEAKACPKKDLKKKCTAKKLQPKMAETCKMCYPKPNAKLINEHCQKRWKRERRAFYIVCFVLIGVTLVSGLVLRLRRLYVQKRGQKETEEGTKQTGELYHYDGAKPSGPYDGPKSPIICYDGANSSTSLKRVSANNGPSHAVDEDEQFGELWEEDECDIGSSTVHKKWKQLGLLSRNSRKRVQDLFDVEAMRSKREVGNQQPGDKIPVIPRAPNATVRQGSRRGRFERKPSQVDLRQEPNGGTI